jgi:hypothetical protein
LVIHYIDKAANNIAFRCINAYVADLEKELGSHVYEKLEPEGGREEGVDAKREGEKLALKIGKGHQLFLKKLRLDNGTKLGYLYAATKFHKDGSRFIAGMPNCSTTKASKVLSDVFTEILTVLEEKDDVHIQRTGIRRFFVVKGFEEVADFLKKWKFNKNNSRLLKTGDFSNAYTSIPHGDVVEKLSLVFEEVWKFMAEILGVTLDKVKVQWLGHKNVNCQNKFKQ